MPYSPTPVDIWEVLSAVMISVISGAIAITRRIVLGHTASWLWIISEFMTAILCGYLMYNTYPIAQPFLPEWVTLPVAVAFVAHSGGRIFQESEAYILKKYLGVIPK